MIARSLAHTACNTHAIANCLLALTHDARSLAACRCAALAARSQGPGNTLRLTGNVRTHARTQARSPNALAHARTHNGKLGRALPPSLPPAHTTHARTNLCTRARTRTLARTNSRRRAQPPTARGAEEERAPSDAQLTIDVRRRGGGGLPPLRRLADAPEAYRQRHCRAARRWLGDAPKRFRAGQRRRRRGSDDARMRRPRGWRDDAPEGRPG